MSIMHSTKFYYFAILDMMLPLIFTALFPCDVYVLLKLMLSISMRWRYRTINSHTLMSPTATPTTDDEFCPRVLINLRNCFNHLRDAFRTFSIHHTTICLVWFHSFPNTLVKIFLSLKLNLTKLQKRSNKHVTELQELGRSSRNRNVKFD